MDFGGMCERKMFIKNLRFKIEVEDIIKANWKVSLDTIILPFEGLKQMYSEYSRG